LKTIRCFYPIAKNELRFHSPDKIIQDKIDRNIMIDKLNTLNSEALDGYIK